jgi:hypothetical protein
LLPTKIMRGWSSDRGEKEETPREANPMRVAVSVLASASSETRTLAGSKTLKRRFPDQPQEGTDVRKNALLCGWKSTLKGNPMGGTGMKQGREVSGGARP